MSTQSTTKTSLDIQDIHGRTQLWLACEQGDLELLHSLHNDDSNNFLLQIHKADHYNRTPLYIACLYGHYHIVQYLCNHCFKAPALSQTTMMTAPTTCVAKSTYNLQYFCEINNYKVLNNIITIYFTVYGDLSLGRIQNPSRSTLRSTQGLLPKLCFIRLPNPGTNVRSGTPQHVLNVKKLSGILSYSLESLGAVAEDVSFRFGQFGYQGAELLLAQEMNQLPSSATTTTPLTAAFTYWNEQVASYAKRKEQEQEQEPPSSSFEFVCFCVRHAVHEPAKVLECVSKLETIEQVTLFLEMAKSQRQLHEEHLSFLTIIFYISDAEYKVKDDDTGLWKIPNRPVLKMRRFHPKSNVLRKISEYARGVNEERVLWKAILECCVEKAVENTCTNKLI